MTTSNLGLCIVKDLFLALGVYVLNNGLIDLMYIYKYKQVAGY